ncbi:hypothetical protein JNK13_00055 [bacterium]|nr:hypothetical protein [bacterium]
MQLTVELLTGMTTTELACAAREQVFRIGNDKSLTFRELMIDIWRNLELINAEFTRRNDWTPDRLVAFSYKVQLCRIIGQRWKELGELPLEELHPDRTFQVTYSMPFQITDQASHFDAWHRYALHLLTVYESWLRGTANDYQSWIDLVTTASVTKQEVAKLLHGMQLSEQLLSLAFERGVTYSRLEDFTSAREVFLEFVNTEISESGPTARDAKARTELFFVAIKLRDEDLIRRLSLEFDAFVEIFRRPEVDERLGDFRHNLATGLISAGLELMTIAGVPGMTLLAGTVVGWVKVVTPDALRSPDNTAWGEDYRRLMQYAEERRAS